DGAPARTRGPPSVLLRRVHRGPRRARRDGGLPRLPLPTACRGHPQRAGTDRGAVRRGRRERGRSSRAGRPHTGPDHGRSWRIQGGSLRYTTVDSDRQHTGVENRMTERPYYTLSEAAQVLGVHYETAARWARTGKLPSVKLSRRKVIVPKEKLDA